MDLAGLGFGGGLFGAGAAPTAGPEESPAEDAPAEETVVDAPAQEEPLPEEEEEPDTGGGGGGDHEPAASPPEDAPATQPKWTSNIGAWFGAWKDGGQVQVRQLDGLTKIGADGVIIQGQLWKKGAHAGDNFLSRWVRVDKSAISYSAEESTPVIDRIAFSDMIAICYYKAPLTLTDPTRPEDGTIMVAHHHDASDDHAQVDDMEDQTKKFAAAAKLHVNVVFRDEIYEDEILHLQDVVLGPSDFAAVCAKTSYQRGRVFVFRAETKESAEQWSETLSRVLATYSNNPVEKVGALNHLRRSVRWFYVGDKCQIFVACLILSNFITNIFEAHFTPEMGSPMEKFFDKVDTGFTIIFTVELLTNMFATMFVEFLTDAWNWFDLVVVVISLLSMVFPNLPGANVLRLMRCFRVFRLFKRIPSLRQIIVALTASVPPMINAFLLVCLVTAIYAIVGVTFFSAKSPDNFVDFFTAMFTMFQVMTGDNWSDIARDLFVETGMGAAVAMYFVSFQLIVALVLVNVVIAVLLDEFSKAADRRDAGAAGGGDDGADANRCPFEKIAKYLADYKDLDDLESMINDLYDRIVARQKLKSNSWGFVDDTPEGNRRLLRAYFQRWRTGKYVATAGDGKVGFAEFRVGIKSLGFIPPLIVTKDVWDEYVLEQGSVLGVKEEEELLSRRGFVGLMKQALKRYQLRNLNMSLESEPDSWNQAAITAVLLGVKGLLVEDLELAKGGLLVASGSGTKKYDEVPDYIETEDEAERAATELLLKRLVTDMHKMHKRFDAVESELSAMSNAKNKIAKPAAPLAPRGPGEPQEGTAPETGTKSAKAGFIGKMASQRRAQTSSAAPSSSLPTATPDNLAQKPGGGQLTARVHETPAPSMWGMQGLANLTDASKTPFAAPDPSKMFAQGNDAANNLMGGFMGGLSSIGNAASNAVPKMPEGMQMKMPEMPGGAGGFMGGMQIPSMQMPAMPSMQMPTIPGMGGAATAAEKTA